MSHHCHAKGCTTKCKPEFLMCPRHWRMVPRNFQNLVYRYYQPGQCELSPLPSEKWHAAADLAIGAVAFKESRISEETFGRIKAKARDVLKPEKDQPHD